MARHIEYGYVVETAPRTAVDRVLVTGEASQLAQQQEAFTHLSLHTRDLALYTSHTPGLVVDKAIPLEGTALSQDGTSLAVDSIPIAAMPDVELQGFGRGI